jgi:hypothetical protein
MNACSMKIAFVVAMLVLSVSTSARTLSFGREAFFYDELIYGSNFPSYSSYRSKWLKGGDNRTVYGGEFSFPGGDTTLQPTDASIDSLADSMAAQALAGTYPNFALDIESWPSATQADRNTIRDRWFYIINRMVTRQPVLNGKVGVYSWPPLRDYWNATSCPSAGCDTWKAKNDDLNFCPLLTAAGIKYLGFPDLYQFYYEASPWASTRKYINENMAEAVRLCPASTHVVFVWFQYHEGGNQSARLISSISADCPANIAISNTHAIQVGATVRLLGMTGADSIEDKLLTVASVPDNQHITVNWLDGKCVNGSGVGYVSGGSIYTNMDPAQMRDTFDTISAWTPYMLMWGGYLQRWEYNDPWWNTFKDWIEGR